MKLKVGQKLFNIREERKLNQQEMADLLNMTPSSYSRLERGETSVEIDQLMSFSQKLQVPVQDLLPDILSIHNNSHGNGGGLIFGNYYNNNYHNSDEKIKEQENQISELNKQIESLKIENETLKKKA
jgi:transcriptional regulator with XRE-family HTH domain